MSIEQQREYVQILKKAWLKNLRVCGAGSGPELGMLDALVTEWQKLKEMEASNGSD